MTQVVSWSLANAVYLTKHDGNGDNRFAIIIQGGSGDNSFEEDQYTNNVQEMARLLTEHPRNIKPGPGYTGYYLQDQMYFAQSHDLASVYRDIPELEKDVEIPKVSRHDGTGKTRILNMIKEVVRTVDSYDDVLFFYTSHGRPHTWLPYKDRKFLFDANNHHSGATNDQKYSTTGDIWIKELDAALDPVICHKMILILQPCYSGNWIEFNSADTYQITLVNDVNEKNRVVFTSEVKAGHTTATDTKMSIFDKCNDIIDHLNKRYVKADSGEEDGEKFWPPPQTSYKYVVSDNANGINDGVYEINKDDENYDTVIDFYENQDDEGAEFVSGLTEAFYIDRDYYYYDSTPSLQHHEPNGYLDADDNNVDPENIQGNQNEYISCKEAYYFMLNWHLGFRLGSSKIGAPSPGTINTWYDNPQYEPTNLEEGNNYLF